MKWPKRKSDRELVEQVERYRSWRKPLAIFWMAISLIYVICAVWFYRLVSTGIYPAQSDIFDETHRVWFGTGLMVGYFGGKCFLLAVIAITAGVCCFFIPSRKDQLLIELFHRLDELSEINRNGQLKKNQEPLP